LGADPQIHGDIKDTAVGAAHQLAHRRREVLVVEAAQDALLRARMVVLHELVSDPGFGELALLVCLEKEASFVAAHLRLDEDEALEPGRPDPDAQ
jgi:hypothetical protein